jgi:hypothetical protein
MAWQDIYDRLENAGVLEEYRDGDLIIFHSVALKAEATTC